MVPVAGRQPEEVGKTDAGQGQPFVGSSSFTCLKSCCGFFFQFDFYCLFGLNACHSCCKVKYHKGQCSLVSHSLNTS